ncbi:MAG TPA: methyl-accepting chemotaxis protein [Dissulfurispiraceae bacterium]|nr:methyl-accepting chemotaxis protein [Dissulfurispiraceae bacterium]
MNLFRFKNWSISTKIIGISVFIITVSFLWLFFYIMPLMQKKLTDEKRIATKSIVEVAYSIVANYDARVQKGELTLPDAQQRAIANIESLRYKDKDYVWINDMHPTMVMHPMKPEMDGKDISDFKDPNGKKLFVEMVNVCKDKGEGFVDYEWPKPGATKPVPKISFVKLYQPWGWIMGSGIYVDDVASEMLAVRKKVAIATAAEALLIALIVYGLSLIITRPLKAGIVFANKLAQGDFTVPDLCIKSKDEAGLLAVALNKTKGELGNLLSSAMGDVSGTSAQVYSASNDLSATVRQMTNRLDEQAKRTTQVATATTEMSQTVVDIAKNASNIAASAVDTLKVAETGQNIVSQTVGEVQVISSTVAESAESITALGERSKEIFEIVDVIKDIADQTNLLALNAAIEAARAGEQGRGFAVVADEVRKLAEKTSKATAEVGQMIGAIQSETAKAVQAMTGSQKRVEKGVQLSAQAGDALRKILESVKGLHSMVEQIASATEEMSSVSDAISSDIETIADVSKETSGSAAAIEKASNNLTRLSDDLQQITKKFKTTA